MSGTRTTAIVVRDLGKLYHLGEARPHGSLYDSLGRLVGGRRAPRTGATIWALREVSFDVPRGHVVGVIGRNGSGKSTLLKILARVTAPTEGMAEIVGRVTALLEVGTGFHPELSGRDNIALSGAILGMRRSDVAALAGSIVEFAEIERFVDTPVKHYSSGMYVRLAFSVSAHLVASIMLVDEVLAVGDAGFQRKCHQRIRELVREGRTVLFVSHNMESVRTLCDSAVVLDNGTVRYAGDPDAAAVVYTRDVLGFGAPDTPGDQNPRQAELPAGTATAAP